LDVVEMYRRAFGIFRANYIIALPFIAVNVSVALLFGLLAGGVMMAGESAAISGAPLGLSMGAVLGAAVGITLLSWVLNILAQGMAVGMSSAALRGGASLDNGLEVLGRKLGPLIVAGLLVSLTVGAGLVLLILPGLIAGFLLMFTAIALVLEDLDALEAMRRSYRVVRSNLGDAFVYALLMVVLWLVGGMLGALLAKVPVVGYSLLSPALDGVVSAVITIAGVLFFTEATGTAPASSEG